MKILTLRKLIIFSLILGLTLVMVFIYLSTRHPVFKNRTDLPTAEATLRETDTGKIIGALEDNGSHVWLGIPYAKPPIKELRWKRPQKVDPWTGTRKAVSNGPICPQIGGPVGGVPESSFGKPIGEEDCLYLNIWSPPLQDKNPNKLPVMVWIHGGGNSIGHGGNYIGKDLAVKQQVVVVTFNYRLGPMGFFYHKALADPSNTAANNPANFAYLDIIEVLGWVRRNIENFGGDPGNVTIFGESAGGNNTVALLQSPLAKGLFHKAISQSAIFSTASLNQASNLMTSSFSGSEHSSSEIICRLLIKDGLAENRENAIKVLNNFSLLELRNYLYNKGSHELIEVYEKWAGGMLKMPGIIRDGVTLPLDLTGEHFHQIPVILGTNRDEFKLFLTQDTRFVNIYFGLYRTIKDPQAYEIYAGYHSKAWKARGVDNIAKDIVKSGNQKVYTYRFDWDEEPTMFGMDLSQFLGAAHGVEIPFVFGNRESGFTSFVTHAEVNKEGIEALSDQMMSYWTQFAHSGNPGRGRNGEQVKWEPWSPDQTKTMVLDTQKGGGVRLELLEANLSAIKRRLLAETELTDPSLHCQLYEELFFGTSYWNANEYRMLGQTGCKSSK